RDGHIGRDGCKVRRRSSPLPWSDPERPPLPRSPFPGPASPPLAKRGFLCAASLMRRSRPRLHGVPTAWGASWARSNGRRAMSDWLELKIPWWEIVLRASIVYFVMLALLRVSGKRTVGQFTPFDLLVLVLLGDAVQGSM